MSTAERGRLAEPDLLVTRTLIGGEWLTGDREPAHHGLEEYLNVKYFCQAGL